MPDYPSKIRYDKKNVVRITTAFNRNTEPELVKRIERAAEEEGKAKYIKRLVREDVEKNGA